MEELNIHSDIKKLNYFISKKNTTYYISWRTWFR